MKFPCKEKDGVLFFDKVSPFKSKLSIFCDVPLVLFEFLFFSNSKHKQFIRERTIVMMPWHLTSSKFLLFTKIYF